MNYFFHSSRWFQLAEVQKHQADLFLIQMAFVGAGMAILVILFGDYFRRGK